MVKLRVGMLRIAQETNALSPVLSEWADFERTHWLQGEALAKATGRWGREVPGFLRHAELSGFMRAARAHRAQIEVVPLFSAWAVPSGPLSTAALERFRALLVEHLQGVALDGLFVSMHGAMRGQEGADPEAVLLKDLRQIVGPQVKIAVSLDLHAQLSQEKLRWVDWVAAYRTNPHRDHAKLGERLGKILIRGLLGEARPVSTWRSLPMVLGGGTTIDFLPTMRPLFRRMSQMEKDPRVLYVSLCMSHLWSDDPDPGWAVVVITDGEQALGERLAEELADRAWGVRHALPPALPGASEAIAKARGARWARRLGTVVISDASDMVGAGAAGENTRLVQALLDEGQGMLSYAPLRDAEAVERLWDLARGSEVSLSVGGKLDPNNPPLKVQGRLRRTLETRAFGRVAVLDLDHVQLVLTSHAPLAMKPSFYRSVGLHPSRADICVVKSLFPFRLYFLLHNRLTIYAKTEGVTDFDAVTRVTFEVPVHPLEEVAAWRPTDRRRRGLLDVE